MPRFKSIISRIVFLHIVAIIIASVFERQVASRLEMPERVGDELRKQPVSFIERERQPFV